MVGGVSVIAASVMLVFGILIVVGCLFGIIRMFFVTCFSFVHALDVDRFHTMVDTFLRRPAESTAVIRNPRVTAEEPTIGTRPNNLVNNP